MSRDPCSCLSSVQCMNKVEKQNTLSFNYIIAIVTIYIQKNLLITDTLDHYNFVRTFFKFIKGKSIKGKKTR